MKKILLFLVLILGVVSCQKQTVDPANPPTNSGSSLEFSTIDDISVDTTLTYDYYDPITDKKGTLNFGEFIAKTPHTIVYFYPKDGTPNCTIQGGDFSAMKEKFLEKGYQIVGVSREGVDTHKDFCEKNKFTIPLISDTKSDLLKQFKALGPLGKYGNGDDVTDIIRSTFIIDSKGAPVYAFRDVQAIGHAQRILDLISQ